MSLTRPSLRDRELEHHPALDPAVLRLRRVVGVDPDLRHGAAVGAAGHRDEGAPPPWRIPPSPEPKSTPAGARLLESRPAATLAFVFVETFCGLGGGSIFLISGLTRAISWVSDPGPGG